MFAQLLALVKGEKRHAAGGLPNNLPADDRAVLITDEFSGRGHRRAGKAFGFGRHGLYCLTREVVGEGKLIVRPAIMNMPSPSSALSAGNRLAEGGIEAFLEERLVRIWRNDTAPKGNGLQ